MIRFQDVPGWLMISPWSACMFVTTTDAAGSGSSSPGGSLSGAAPSDRSDRAAISERDDIPRSTPRRDCPISLSPQLATRPSTPDINLCVHNRRLLPLETFACRCKAKLGACHANLAALMHPQRSVERRLPLYVASAAQLGKSLDLTH
jgi:hypothetical protein